MSSAAEAQGIGYVLSTMANYSCEEVAKRRCNKNGLFFQLYCVRSREFIRRVIRDAECSGYKGIVVTVDAPILGRRIMDEVNKFTYKNLPVVERYISLLE